MIFLWHVKANVLLLEISGDKKLQVLWQTRSMEFPGFSSFAYSSQLTDYLQASDFVLTPEIVQEQMEEAREEEDPEAENADDEPNRRSVRKDFHYGPVQQYADDFLLVGMNSFYLLFIYTPFSFVVVCLLWF